MSDHNLCQRRVRSYLFGLKFLISGFHDIGDDMRLLANDNGPGFMVLFLRVANLEFFLFDAAMYNALW